MHSVGAGRGGVGGCGLTLISSPLYRPLRLSNLSTRALPASTEALLLLPQKPSLYPAGGTRGAREPTLKHDSMHMT